MVPVSVTLTHLRKREESEGGLGPSRSFPERLFGGGKKSTLNNLKNCPVKGEHLTLGWRINIVI